MSEREQTGFSEGVRFNLPPDVLRAIEAEDAVAANGFFDRGRDGLEDVGDALDKTPIKE